MVVVSSMLSLTVSVPFCLVFVKSIPIQRWSCKIALTFQRYYACLHLPTLTYPIVSETTVRCRIFNLLFFMNCILLISILRLSNILILNLRPLYSLQVLARPSICYQIISALITFHIDLTYHTRSSHWIQPVIFALLNGGLIHLHLIILHTLHARYSTLIIHLSLTITDSALMSRCQE